MAAISGAEVASRLAGYIDWLVHFLGIAKKKTQPTYILWRYNLRLKNIHSCDCSIHFMPYRVVCPACDASFSSYEKYVDHVFKDHSDQPALRMKARIVRD
jgi:uncharacterized C2H2 Zn-finger protein